MWNKPSEKKLATLPALYGTEKIKLRDTIIQLHFFIGGCDWYCCEYSKEENIFFGFAIINSDLQNAEWGYTSFQELCEISVGGVQVDRDLNFTPKKAIEVEKIKEAQNW